jgi:hypothetical protein
MGLWDAYGRLIDWNQKFDEKVLHTARWLDHYIPGVAAPVEAVNEIKEELSSVVKPVAEFAHGVSSLFHGVPPPQVQSSSLRSSSLQSQVSKQMGQGSYRSRYRRSRRRRRRNRPRLYRRVREHLNAPVKRVNLVWDTAFALGDGTVGDAIGFAFSPCRPRSASTIYNNGLSSMNIYNTKSTPIGWNDLIKQYDYYACWGMKVSVDFNVNTDTTKVIGVIHTSDQGVSADWTDGSAAVEIDSTGTNGFYNYMHDSDTYWRRAKNNGAGGTDISMSRYISYNSFTHTDVGENEEDLAVSIGADPSWVSGKSVWVLIMPQDANETWTDTGLSGRLKLEYYITFMNPDDTGYDAHS